MPYPVMMRGFFLLLVTAAVGCSPPAARDQAATPTRDCPADVPQGAVVMENVSDPAEPVGGIDGLMRRIRYPELARRACIEGVVEVQAYVSPEGCVVDAVCVNDPGGQTCEEALRTVRGAPFTPGRDAGSAAWITTTLQIPFELTAVQRENCAAR